MAGFLDNLESIVLGEFERELNTLARQYAKKFRYSTGASAGGILNQILALFKGTSRRRGRSQLPDLEIAKRLLELAGYTVTKRGTIEPVSRGLGRRLPSERFPGEQSPTRPGRRTVGDRTPPETAPGGAPPREGEESGYGEEIFTPQSSNVFSFSFKREARTRGTLYVTFKANTFHSGSLSRGKGSLGGREQLHGAGGHTVSGKSNSRGAMYAYYDVPVVVYERMKRATSKGKFVWDELRVRGTIYGHKYTYQLVQGQVAPQHGGVYIPRKATKRGFATRSVGDLGTGRRGFQSSTLPSQRGFSTRRSLGR